MNTHRQANPPVFTSKSTSSSKTNAFAPENSNIQELIESLKITAYRLKQVLIHHHNIQLSYKIDTNSTQQNTMLTKLLQSILMVTLKAQYFLLNIM